MPHASFVKGLDPQVSLWRSSDQAVDEIRFSSNKEVYATCQIKYTNLTYWQDEIQTRVLQKKSSDSAGGMGGPVGGPTEGSSGGSSGGSKGGGTGGSMGGEGPKNPIGPKKMSLDAFKDKHASLEENTRKNIIEDGQKNILYKKNLLDHAISCGQNDFLNILIESGTDINTIINDENNRTMLHLAVLNTDILRVKYLVAHGAHVNCSDYKGQTPLHMSILPASVSMILRHKDITRYLLSNGADVNMQDERGYTVLHRLDRSTVLSLDCDVSDHCYFCYYLTIIIATTDIMIISLTILWTLSSLLLL